DIPPAAAGPGLPVRASCVGACAATDPGLPLPGEPCQRERGRLWDMATVCRFPSRISSPSDFSWSFAATIDGVRQIHHAQLPSVLTSSRGCLTTDVNNELPKILPYQQI
ncbi:unnamed protein product, partial [Urochloa humidicola]